MKELSSDESSSHGLTSGSVSVHSKKVEQVKLQISAKNSSADLPK